MDQLKSLLKRVAALFHKKKRVACTSSTLAQVMCTVYDNEVITNLNNAPSICGGLFHGPA